MSALFSTNTLLESTNILGIDLGTERIKLSVPDATGTPRVLPHPCGASAAASALFFGKDGKVIVGQAAIYAGYQDPGRLVVNWKRYLGTDEVLAHDHNGKPVTAYDAAVHYFNYICDVFKKATGKPPENAVVCVPANLTNAQLKEIKKAAESAGLIVQRLLPEPTAAAMGNGLHQRAPGLYLVIDIGGGTSDVALIEVQGNNLDVKRSNGVAKLGGLDWSQRLADFGLDRFADEHGVRPDPETDGVFRQELSERVEQGKKMLSTQPSVNIVIAYRGQVCTVEVTRDKFEELTRDLLDGVLDCGEQTLDEEGVKPQDLQGVLAVGGPSTMPMVARGIKERFDIDPLDHCEQHFGASHGAVVAGRIECDRTDTTVQVGDRALPPIDLYSHEVTHHALGILVLNDARGGTFNSMLIDKAMPMPSDQTAKFQLAQPGQTSAKIELLQGPDGAPSEDCASLGVAELDGLTPRYDDPHPIEVRVQIDINGLLTLSAHDRLSAKSAKFETSVNQTHNTGVSE